MCLCVCTRTCWWCHAFHSTCPSHVCPIYLLHCLRQWCWGLSWNYLLCLLYTVAVLLGLHLVWLRTWDLSSWMGLWYEAENIPYCFCATLTENLFIYICSLEWQQQIKTAFSKILCLDYTRSDRNPWRFGNTAVSGTTGMGNSSLSALLARLEAFHLPWSAGLQSNGISLWRRISKPTTLSTWLSGYLVGTSIFIEWECP